MTVHSLDVSQIRDERLYTMDEAAKCVGTSRQTLIIYRKRKLVFPQIKGKSPLFSSDDIQWMRCVRELIHVNKISIAAVKKLIEYAPCWEIRKCSGEQRAHCMRLPDSQLPGRLRVPPGRGALRGISTSILPSPGNGHVRMSNNRVRCRFAKHTDRSGDTLKS